MAGQHPESAYSHYAIANMTGANRLLIGVGWSSIVLVFARRFHTGVSLPDDKRTDVLFSRAGNHLRPVYSAQGFADLG